MTAEKRRAMFKIDGACPLRSTKREAQVCGMAGQSWDIFGHLHSKSQLEADHEINERSKLPSKSKSTNINIHRTIMK